MAPRSCWTLSRRVVKLGRGSRQNWASGEACGFAHLRIFRFLPGKTAGGQMVEKIVIVSHFIVRVC